MKALTFRVLSGITTAVTLIALPAAATADSAAGPATAPASPLTAVGIPAAATTLPFQLSVPGATATGSYQMAKPSAVKPVPGKPVPGKPVPGKPVPGKPVKPAPGTAVSGIGQPAQAQPGKSLAGIVPVRESRNGTSRLAKPPAVLALTLKVTDRTRCGILQLTTHGPADGIEWYTIGTLCRSGTAAFRVEATRLPWSAGALPSLRLCNGLRPALAEGDDCDTFKPPAGA